MSANKPIKYPIFYNKLKDAQTNTNVICYLLILPHNKWIKIENIVDITPSYVTFSFFWKTEGENYYTEETVHIQNIKSLRICVPISANIQNSKNVLKKIFEKENQT